MSEVWVDHDHPPRPRQYEQCASCRGDLVMRHVCNEYAAIPTKAAMRALIGDWHDANEAGCCDDEGPFCPSSKAYAQGYLAALAAVGL